MPILSKFHDTYQNNKEEIDEDARILQKYDFMNKQELLNIANKYFLEGEPTFGNIVQEALYKIEEFNRIPEIIEFEEIPESVMFTKHDIILERIRIYEELVQKFDYDNDKKVLKELIYLSGLI